MNEKKCINLLEMLFCKYYGDSDTARQSFYEWLHSKNEELKMETPFEVIKDGQGELLVHEIAYMFFGENNQHMH